MGKNKSPRPPPLHPQRTGDSCKNDDVWQEVAEEGSGDKVKTWTQQGTSSGRVEWQRALEYGQMLYEDITQRPHHKTESGNCEVAVLYAWYNDSSSIGTMVFMSSIPRGHTQNDALGRLAGPTGGHPEWRKHCRAEYEAPVWKSRHGPPKYYDLKTQYYATHIHAVDNAINLYLNAKDAYPNLIWIGTHLVIYGLDTRIRAKPPGQLTPCEEYEVVVWDDYESCSDDEQSRSYDEETCWDEGNSLTSFEKAPCCTSIMARMDIEYEYGKAKTASETSWFTPRKYYCYFDRLPAARGSGCGGGGRYHTARNHHHGSRNEQNSASLMRRDEKMDSESASAAALRRSADKGSANVTAPRIQRAASNDIPTVRTTPAPSNGNNTRSIPVAVKQLAAAPLGCSLAMRPLGGKTTSAPPVGVPGPLQTQSQPGASGSKQQQGNAPLIVNKTPATQSRTVARNASTSSATTPAAARLSAPVRQDGTQGRVPSSRLENRASAPTRQDNGHLASTVETGRPVPPPTRIPRATTARRQT